MTKHIRVYSDLLEASRRVLFMTVLWIISREHISLALAHNRALTLTLSHNRALTLTLSHNMALTLTLPTAGL